MEEHSFYLFLYCVLGTTKCLCHASCLPSPDREVILARLQIYRSDLRDELQNLKSFPTCRMMTLWWQKVSSHMCDPFFSLSLTGFFGGALHLCSSCRLDIIPKEHR